MMVPQGISYCDGLIRFNASYKDLATFHGGRYPAGVALGYKALQLVQQSLFPDGGVLMRQKCRVETAFMGLGFRDVLEMALRSSTLGQLKRKPSLPVPQGIPAAPVQGHFFFRFLHDNGVLEFSLKPSLVPQEFYEKTEALQHCENKEDAEEELLVLRSAVAKVLMEAEPFELFNIHHLKPVRAVTEEFFPPVDFESDFCLPLRDFGVFNATLPLLQAYHGEDSLCGLCLIASLMKRFMVERGHDTPLNRRSCSVKAGAWGKGISDGLACLLRTDNNPERLLVHQAWGESYLLPTVPGGGSFVFQLEEAGEAPMIFALQSERVPTEYFDLCRKRNKMGPAFDHERQRKERQIEFARSVLCDDPWKRLS